MTQPTGYKPAIASTRSRTSNSGVALTSWTRPGFRGEEGFTMRPPVLAVGTPPLDTPVIVSDIRSLRSSPKGNEQCIS